MPQRTFQVVNTTRGTSLATAAWRADNAWTRFVGLMGRSGLAVGAGLHIVPCKSIHMWFMRFPIDVVYLDRDRRVVKVVPALGVFRFSWGGKSANSVLELPSGTIAETGTIAGDELTFTDG